MNAECFNLLGSHECKCRTPYVGNGYSCSIEAQCAQVCNENARCEYGRDGQTMCVCKQGFKGDGLTCTKIGI